MKQTRNSGMFKPGRSGNPGGRPKQIAGIRELCQQFSIEAIEILMGIVHDPKSKDSDRIRCIEIILDRGYGKPLQPNRDLGQGESWAEFWRSV